MDIRLGVMELGWRNPKGDALVSYLKDARLAGYEGVTGFHHAGFSDYFDKPEAFRTLLEGEGLALTSMDIVTQADHETVHKTCAFMAALDCDILVCLGGMGTAAEDYVSLGPVLNEIGAISREYGIRTHYHNGRTRETIADMETVLANTDPDLVHGMCDTGHATRDFVEIERPQDRAAHFIGKHWDRIGFIEFKDWCEETELDTPLGEGVCDYDQVFDLIKRRGYSGWILVEQNGNEDRQGDRTPLDCAKASREFIRKGLGV